MQIFKFMLLFCVSPSNHALNVQYCRKLDFQYFFLSSIKMLNTWRNAHSPYLENKPNELCSFSGSFFYLG